MNNKKLLLFIAITLYLQAIFVQIVAESNECAMSLYGCCSDGITTALDESYSNCPTSSHTTEKCDDTEYGCCNDGITIAKGPFREGCIDNSCESTRYGCCDDLVTVANSESKADCPITCEETFYGCCLDNVSTARGTGYAGCERVTGTKKEEKTTKSKSKIEKSGLESSDGDYVEDEDVDTKIPINDDKRTTLAVRDEAADNQARNNLTNNGRLTCAQSKYECCPDGEVAALGHKFEGCKDVDQVGDQKTIAQDEDICSLPSEPGPCYEYKTQWRYDSVVGRCVQFWYGGCDGNANRFNTEEECEKKCVSPPGTDVCKLQPINPEGCSENLTRYYFDAKSGKCERFTYNGCFGNSNNFETVVACENRCKLQLLIEKCTMLPERGPCKGDHQRWFFNSKSGVCEKFSYGGCLKNANNFQNENECVNSCVKPKQDAVCILPTIVGSCKEKQDKWTYDFTTGKCKTFKYSGCDGNLNRFETKVACMYSCQGLQPYESRIPEEICNAPKMSGNCNSKIKRYYFNKTINMCHEFTYSGCDGNANNFEDEVSCRTTCKANEIDPCVLAVDSGPGDQYALYWHYNFEMKQCMPFYFGGVDGNPNRFTTREHCELTCTLPKETLNLVKKIPQNCLLNIDKGSSCEETKIKWNFDIKTDTCYPFDYTGCGLPEANRFETETDCFNHCNTAQYVTNQTAETVDICDVDIDSSGCSKFSNRWHYDKSLKACKQFQGCDGGQNNFHNKQSCVSLCEKKKKKEICFSHKIVGPCLFFQQKWYFDVEKKSCLSFNYGGCMKNDNNFGSLAECNSFCNEFLRDELLVDHIHTLPSNNDYETNDDKNSDAELDYDQCSLPVIFGNCNEGLERWFFESNSRTCQLFKYGGCNGNKNNFLTREQCESTCSISTSTISPNIPEDDQSCPNIGACDLGCQYGYSKTHNGCNICECFDPCANVNCPSDSKCGVDNKKAICRPISKDGACPDKNKIFDNMCRIACDDDSSCEFDEKCCKTNCGSKCVLPSFDVSITIEEFREHIDTVEGSIAVLPCKVNGYPKPNVTWFKNRHEIIFSSEEKRIIKALNNSLIIFNVSDKDEATYTCKATNSLNSQNVLKEGKLIVHVHPEIIETDKTLLVDQSSIAILTCPVKANSPLIVNWLFNNNLLIGDEFRLSSEEKYFFNSNNKSLTILKTRTKDSGIYACKIKNSIRNSTAYSNITLIVLKTVHKSVYKLDAKEKSDIELRCNASTNSPILNISWQINNNTWLNSSKYEFKNNQNILRIHFAEEEDSAAYTCQAETLDSVFIIENIVKIKKIPQTILKRVHESVNNIEVSEMSDIELNCGEIKNQNNQILKINWTINNVELKVSPKYEFKKNKKILKINTVGFEDSAVYTCQVETSDRVFVTENLVTIKRRLQLSIKSKFSRVEVNRQRTAIMDCFWWYKNDSVLMSKSSIKWYSNDNELNFSDAQSKYKLNKNKNVLYVTDIKLDDRISYSCVSIFENYDVRISNFTIELKSIFKWMKDSASIDKNIWREKFDNVTLDCSLEAHENRWYFNGKLLQSSDKFYKINENNITIFNLNELREGLYSCEGEKYFEKTSYKVQILEPMRIVEKNKEILARKDDEIELKCSFVGGKPKPSIKWFFNETPLLQKDDDKYLFNGYDLVISNLNINDTGYYTCILANGYHRQERLDFSLIVFEPLEIKFLPSDLLYALGSDANVFCIPNGSPRSQRITWFRDGEKIETNSKYIVNRTQLTINSIQSSDAGAYTCKVTNSYTSVVAEANVRVTGSITKLECEDVSSYLNCRLIVAKRMCLKYGTYCCKTCSAAGFDVKLDRNKNL